ncbi:MAG: putative baseplate assembly protein [Hyphomicrobiales bacterium]|nr:MAG: putative baseplate assembly protein [Hyphomicrobiales bacterium]
MSGCDPFGPACAGDERREFVRASGALCGIDDIEVYEDGVSLCVRLFGAPPQGLGPENVVITGGARITGIKAARVDLEEIEDEGACLRVTLDRTGDFSTYCLCLTAAPAADDAACSFLPPAPAPLVRPAPAGVDPRYACAEFRFHLDCPCDDDCAPRPCVGEAPPPDIPINYLARDFAGFRQLLLDRLALAMPDWRERHLPDLQLTALELLAYLGDRLSYQLDAVATEAYLGTARKRISLRRHARLLDYRMYEGCNARAFVCVSIEGGDLLDRPASDFLFAAPNPDDPSPATGLAPPERLDGNALVFEPVVCAPDATISLRAAHSSIPFHTWRQSECCLPRGATRATLRDGAPPAAGEGGGGETRALDLRPGDLLILEETRGADTGAAADADPAKRWPVRLVRVEPLVDPLDGAPLLEVEWGQEDALPFALQLSSWTAPDAPGALRLAPGGTLVVVAREATGEALPEGGVAIETPPPRGKATIDADGVLTYTAAQGFSGAEIVELAVTTPAGSRVSFTLTFVVGEDPFCRVVETAVARGNVILVDHGRTFVEDNDAWLVDREDVADCCRCDGAAADVLGVPGAFAMTLDRAPVCQAAPAPCGDVPAARLLEQDPRAATAAVALDMADARGGAFTGAFDWRARFDLLGSGSSDRHFVVEIDDDRRARLRFGDDDCGMRPPAGARFRARYRIGNGRAGNVGADTIALMALRGVIRLDGLSIELRNPLPARGGADPEPVEEVRRRAPHGYGRTLERAVTAADYAEIAGRDPRIQGTNGEFSWTGVCYEAEVALDPFAAHAEDADLASDALRRIEAARRIGHDVALARVRRAPLRIGAHVCVDPAYRQDEVARAVRALMSAGSLPDGAPALFHPDRLLFGQDVFASRIVAAIQALDGVLHVELTHFSRLDDVKPGATRRLDSGVIPIAADEIAQCDSDPDYPERGRFSMRIVGGR